MVLPKLVATNRCFAYLQNPKLTGKRCCHYYKPNFFRPIVSYIKYHFLESLMDRKEMRITFYFLKNIIITLMNCDRKLRFYSNSYIQNCIKICLINVFKHISVCINYEKLHSWVVLWISFGSNEAGLNIYEMNEIFLSSSVNCW